MPLPLAIFFLTPWFFGAGAALVSVPIVIHILNRRRFKIVDWAAMEYLLRAMKKNRRRLKFESLLLLATRCAVLLFLGAALARPFGCEKNSLASFAGRKSGLHVFVINNAYSMAYEFERPGAKTHLEQAKAIAKTLINRLSGGSEAVVVLTTAGHQPTGDAAALPTPMYDLESAKAAVDRIDQTFAAADMVGALDRAHRVAAASAGLPNKTLYLLDDSTHGTWARQDEADALSQTGKDLADAFNGDIVHFNLGRPNEFNPLVTALVSSQRLVTLLGDFTPTFVARLRAYGAGADPQLVWKTDDTKLDTNGSGVVRLDLNEHRETLANPMFPGGGPHVVSASLLCDDRLKCDDTRWRVVNVASDLKMLVVEGERQAGTTGGSGVFLHAALAPDPDPTDLAARKRNLVNVDTINDLELATKPLTDYRCVALCGVGGVAEQTAARLEKYVEAGGALWVFMGPQVGADNYNATLFKHHLLPGPLVQRVSVPSAGDGIKFDFDPNGVIHPLLAPFAGRQDTGLQNGKAFSYWQVDLSPGNDVEHVLDYQADAGAARKDAAFTVHSLGQGRVVFCSTTANANDDWTAFPAKKAFPEVMLCLFLGTVNTGDEWMNVGVGDAVQPPATLKFTAAPVLTDPNGVVLPMLDTQNADGDTVYRSAPLSKPGVYTMKAGAATYPVAVNIPAEGGDTRLLDSAALRKILGGIDVTFEQDAAPEEAAALSQGKDMGWSLMAAVLVLVAAESFMAMRFGHHKRK